MAKIVHLTSVATTFHVRIFAKQCRSLAAAGNEVVLLGTHDEDAEADGVKIRTVGKPRGRLHRMLVITTRLLRAALNEKADLYVTHDPELTPIAWVLSAMGHAVVYDMHENTPKQLLTKRWIPRLLRRPVSLVLATIHRTLLQQIPVVFAESSYAKDYTYVRTQTTVLNMPFHGEESDRFSKPTLGYIGGVSELRGAITTLEALQVLHDRGGAPDFECIGPIAPADDTRLHELRSAIASDVRLRGYERSDEGWRRIARCHIGLAVLKDIPNYRESFPGKMFEYLSFGVPVIVSDFPLYRDVVDEVGCGLCVDPDSPQDLADAIEWMLANPKESLAMGRRGKQAIEARYNWPTEFQKLLNFYDRVLAPREQTVARTLTSAQVAAA